MQIPFCVVVGWFMGKPMDLNFQLFETATLFITVLVVAFMLQVGISSSLMYWLFTVLIISSSFRNITYASSVVHLHQLLLVLMMFYCGSSLPAPCQKKKEKKRKEKEKECWDKLIVDHRHGYYSNQRDMQLSLTFVMFDHQLFQKLKLLGNGLNHINLPTLSLTCNPTLQVEMQTSL